MKCPYCKGSGKVKGLEADPSGRKEYPVDQGCSKCGGSGSGALKDQGGSLVPGSGQIACKDASGADLDLNTPVTLTLVVTNLHPGRKSGECTVELGLARADGGVDHLLTCDSKQVSKKA